MGLSTQKQVGLDRPGSDGVHSNAARSELFCYNTNHAFDGALRSAVDAVAGSVEGKRGTGEADQSAAVPHLARSLAKGIRSDEHTSELQSLTRISYAVFCLTKNKKTIKTPHSSV